MLPIVGNKPFSNVTIAQSSTGYTTSHAFQRNSGFTSVIVSVSGGSFTISQQCSPDTINWYDPINGTGTALGVVATSMTASTAYIQYSPVLCQHARFKIIEGGTGAGTVGITICMQEQP